MDVTGDPLTASWSGSVYANAAGVELDRLGLTVRSLGASRLSGRVSGKVWSTWERARLVEAEGTVARCRRGSRTGAQRRGFDELRGSFRVERNAARGWTLATRDLAVATPNGEWPPSTASAAWTPPRDGRYGTFAVSMDFVRIEDLLALLPPDRKLPESSVLDALLAAGPRGAIEQLRVSAPGREARRVRARERPWPIHAPGRRPQGWPVSIDMAHGGSRRANAGWWSTSTGAASSRTPRGGCRTPGGREPHGRVHRPPRPGRPPGPVGRSERHDPGRDGAGAGLGARRPATGASRS